MQTFSLKHLIALASTLVVLAGPAKALDPDARVSPDAGPIELFSFGFHAYKRGEKEEAFEALRYAADKGHRGALWKLGRMYAEGDGVPEDDLAAYRIFERIVREQENGGTSGSNNAYFASAVVALADYLQRGIPGSVEINLPRARQFYFHAASFFGDPKAQFELGMMTLNGEGGRANPRQAARWLKLAAAKGHTRARALLGYLLFDGRKIDLKAEPAKGLALLTQAFQEAGPNEREWIRPMQEEVFALSSEENRRAASAFLQKQSLTSAELNVPH